MNVFSPVHKLLLEESPIRLHAVQERVTKVLLVEDSPTDVMLAEESLADHQFHIQNCDRISVAMRLLAADDFDVVLLDLGLPDSQGLDTLRTLRSQNSQVAVVVFTGKDDERMALEALHEGAQDYLVKGQVPTGQLERAIRYAIERAGARKMLRQSEERLQELTANIHQVLWMIDAAESKILYVSHGYEEIWGRSRQSLIDNPHAYLDGIHPHDLEMMKRKNAEMFQTGQMDAECRILRPDGEVRWVWIRGSPVMEQGRIARLVGSVEDITEKLLLAVERDSLLSRLELYNARKRSEDKVNELNSELAARVAELADANQEMESFGYSISHDLRVPLRAIEGFSRIVMKDYAEALPVEVLTYLQDIRANSLQMGCLIDDLLAFSRMGRQSLQKKRVVPSLIVHECLTKLLPDIAGRQIEIKVGELAECEADPALLRQVWINLISNAIKYTSKCGAATIEIGNCDSDLRSQPTYFVKDNGVGFDMKYAGKLFGVFQRMHRAEDYAGTGVGLAIAQRIVQRHGGCIWAVSERDKGTTFYFTLEGGAIDERKRHCDSAS